MCETINVQFRKTQMTDLSKSIDSSQAKVLTQVKVYNVVNINVNLKIITY